MRYAIFPSDFFGCHIVLSFREDAIGVRLRDVIGPDNMIWGSDYPHNVSTLEAFSRHSRTSRNPGISVICPLFTPGAGLGSRSSQMSRGFQRSDLPELVGSMAEVSPDRAR